MTTAGMGVTAGGWLFGRLAGGVESWYGVYRAAQDTATRRSRAGGGS